jgi:hypothetical protein
LNDRFPALWKYYDVNNQGFLVVERVAEFLKQLVDDVEIENKLQL